MRLVEQNGFLCGEKRNTMAVIVCSSEYYFFDVRDDGWGSPRTASMCIIGGWGVLRRIL